MELEKLKDMLYNAAGGPVGIQMCHEAADAIEQLQAENEKLRNELEQVREDNKKLCSAMMTIRRSENSERMCAEYRVDYCTALSHQETADLARIAFEGLMREDERMRGPQIEAFPTLTPQNDPLTIEELREMDGEPVYIISEFYHISEWNIPNGIGEIVIAYDVPCAGMKEVIPSIKFIDGKELAVEKYGSSWVAYENKDGAVPQKGEFEWIEETY